MNAVQRTIWTLRPDENRYCTVMKGEHYEGQNTTLEIAGAPEKLEEVKSETQ